MLSLNDFKKFELSSNDSISMVKGGIACSEVDAVAQYLWDIGNIAQYNSLVYQAGTTGIQCINSSGGVDYVYEINTEF